MHCSRAIHLSCAFLVLALALPAAGCGASRASVEEVERLTQALRVDTGSRIADVGAGDGEFSEALAELVSESGHVYATEIDEDDLDDIRRRIDGAGLVNVTTILGKATETGLPENCCDAILLRLVYHHLTDPSSMRASLRKSLRPGGVLVVVEIEPQQHWPTLPGVKDRGGHGILPSDLVEELALDGFEVVEQHDDWPGEQDRYCVVFRR